MKPLRSITSAILSTLAAVPLMPSKAVADARICKPGFSWHFDPGGPGKLHVAKVDAGGNADVAGFRPGDVILKVAGKPFAARGPWENSLSDALNTCKPFDVMVMRPGQGGEPARELSLHLSYTVPHLSVAAPR